MHHDYSDIRDLIPEPPKWWDENAVPRYCNFAPSKIADIYADEAALVCIACQNCGTKFPVAFSCSSAEIEMAEHRGQNAKSLAEHIKNDTIHYGDPPNTHCCAAGPTMNCYDLHVIEYWRRNKSTGYVWQRDKELEMPLERPVTA